MRTAHGLIEHLAPDCILRLRRAARLRFEEAGSLQGEHPLAAVYWYGFCVEMYLAAAYFRNVGFAPNQAIDGETRTRHMAQARRNGVMKRDPHPLPGWAELLRWQSSGRTADHQRDRLIDEAVRRANSIYRHWRPELRYKVADVRREWLDEVRMATKWFVDNHAKL
jgi:hypothetical protein